MIAKLVPELAFFRSTTFHLSYVNSAALPLYFQPQGLVPVIYQGLCLHSSDASFVCGSSNSGLFVWSQAEVRMKSPSSQGKDLQILTKLVLFAFLQPDTVEQVCSFGI